MNMTLLKALLALIPLGMIMLGSIVVFYRERSVSTCLQMLGAGCLVVVAWTHIFEALHWLAWMRWGEEHSPGHYVDLCSAILGLTFFPIGYLLHACGSRHA